MRTTLESLNPEYTLLLDEALINSSRKYENIFSHSELEEIIAIARYKAIMYIPETFASKLHAAKWCSLFGKRFLLNSIRDYYTQLRKEKIFKKQTQCNLEKFYCDEYIRLSNSKHTLQIINKVLRSDPSIKEFIKSNLNVSDFAKLIGRSRRLIHYRLQRFKSEVLKKIDK